MLLLNLSVGCLSFKKRSQLGMSDAELSELLYLRPDLTHVQYSTQFLYKISDAALFA